jgi:uncharacterized membrane protein YkvA (DUF1232 family)
VVACVLSLFGSRGPSSGLAVVLQSFSHRVECQRTLQWSDPDRFSVALPARLEVADGAVGDFETADERLNIDASQAFQALRRGVRHVVWFFRWSTARWAEWLLRAAAFLILAVAMPLLDRELVSTWRQTGWRGVRRVLVLGAAVHMRLLMDRRAPVLGKLAVLVALGYGVVSRDVVPDNFFPVGFLDDMVVVSLASRGFMLLCPQSLVESHANLAASAEDR